jgi:hypothetical protein
LLNGDGLRPDRHRPGPRRGVRVGGDREGQGCRAVATCEHREGDPRRQAPRRPCAPGQGFDADGDVATAYRNSCVGRRDAVAAGRSILSHRDWRIVDLELAAPRRRLGVRADPIGERLAALAAGRRGNREPRGVDRGRPRAVAIGGNRQRAGHTVGWHRVRGCVRDRDFTLDGGRRRERRRRRRPGAGAGDEPQRATCQQTSPHNAEARCKWFAELAPTGR